MTELTFLGDPFKTISKTNKNHVHCRKQKCNKIINLWIIYKQKYFTVEIPRKYDKSQTPVLNIFYSF